MEEARTLWFTKRRRAQTNEDYETWVEGGVVPTLNAFDNGDVRATVAILVRMRAGKPGGGKGALLSEDRSLTIATSNDQTLFVFYGNRGNDIRLQDDKINTLQARMGTGGNNMPLVAQVIGIQNTVIGRSDTAGPQGKGHTEEGEPMFTVDTTSPHAVAVAQAYDEYNDSVADTHHTLRAGTKQSTGVIENSIVRRLTPLECERLQGFPDGWTEGQPDTHRYKQMGNAVAVPVVEWIVQGICDTFDIAG